MPIISLGDFSCFYRREGRDDAPALILSHSLGQDHAMWDPQAEAFARHFHVIRYDLRGHGASGVTPGEYTIAQLGRDVIALADAIGLDHFAFCGLSIGGMIGQWLGRNAPERLTHLVLANTSPRPDAAAMEARRVKVLTEGMAAVEDAVMRRFFSERSLEANPPAVAESRRTLRSTDPHGYAGCCAAVRDMDMTSEIEHVATPSLLIAGDQDVSLPWDGHSSRLAAAIPGVRVVRLPTAHLSNLERPRSFNAAVVDFLAGPANRPARNAYDEGLAIRREVLGAEHVDRALAGTTPFNRDFQTLITEFAWGTIWARPGLDHRTRRLLVLAIVGALGRWEEFRLHVRTGLAHELEPADLQEVLLQVALYAGVPAANTGFQMASEILADAASASQG